MNYDHLPVDPLPGAAPWIGGKRNLARQIVPRIEAIPHTCYAEPFVGMGGLFFRRHRRPPSEVINDRSRDVSTFFRVLQRHEEPLLAELRHTLTSRVEFERLRGIDPDTLTDIERSARFFYLQYCAFGGKPASQSLAISPVRSARFDMSRLPAVLDRLHHRLSGVYIECLDFEAFIRRWDRPGTLFYLDPPYWDREDWYGKNLFQRADFERLAGVLAGIAGKFILSLNDVPEVRETFAAFTIDTVETTYRVAACAQRATEVLISGGGGLADAGPRPG